MTCVIKQSLFTHQKLSRCESEFAWQNVFTCQEINNLSYVLLSHLHRPVITVQRRHALAWLHEDQAGLVSIQNGVREKVAPTTGGGSPLNRQKSAFSLRCLQASGFQYNGEKSHRDEKSRMEFSPAKMTLSHSPQPLPRGTVTSKYLKPASQLAYCEKNDGNQCLFIGKVPPMFLGHTSVSQGSCRED